MLAVWKKMNDEYDADKEKIEFENDADKDII